MYTRARSKERFDFTRHYGLGNSVRGVARAIALADLRTGLFVRRYATKNALGRASYARDLVHPPPSSESNCTRASWTEIRISRRPVAPTIPPLGLRRVFPDASRVRLGQCDQMEGVMPLLDCQALD
jgi:hypothetical protein